MSYRYWLWLMRTLIRLALFLGLCEIVPPPITRAPRPPASGRSDRSDRSGGQGRSGRLTRPARSIRPPGPATSRRPWARASRHPTGPHHDDHERATAWRTTSPARCGVRVTPPDVSRPPIIPLIKLIHPPRQNPDSMDR
ncbi:hypothetical protein KIH74_05430 [Kineosporia sp. J2-2]|uniref:Secreted protein n=1 Tax=Kineosporia corallincola TaxID=2835133 RepID=A0ABS5TFG9_9ACTN|nr:hypothetical protein [Kineosporia corallincola]MBT0768354.1 hypothetical protein [Kineosporia corallincola]